MDHPLAEEEPQTYVYRTLSEVCGREAPGPWRRAWVEHNYQMRRKVRCILGSIRSSLWSLTFGRWVFIKRADLKSYPSEIEAMRYVREHTTIPVPRVYGSIFWDNSVYIIMSKIKGDTLRPWNTLSSVSQNHIIRQLRDFISQLRALPPPKGTRIGSVCGTPSTDHRLCMVAHGPYKDEAAMNRQLRSGTSLAFWEKKAPVVVQAHSIQHPLVFTHGDIALRNIMAKGDKVTGLIDWETAGWFPAHWEFIKASFNAHAPDEERWMEQIREFVPPFDMELEADNTLHEWVWWLDPYEGEEEVDPR